MVAIWKRWIATIVGMRVFLVLLYGIAAFGIPLTHTCKLSDTDAHSRHAECSSHLLHNDSYVEVHHTAIFNQNSLSDKTGSHELYCPACLFSLTSKAFKPCSNTSLCSTQTVVRTRVLLQLNFIKQLEWFCSAPLRAPPGIAS